jgi:hypothetical protein
MEVQRVAAYLELTAVSRGIVSEGLSETVAEFRRCWPNSSARRASGQRTSTARIQP